jgi:hypothetical protein
MLGHRCASRLGERRVRTGWRTDVLAANLGLPVLLEDGWRIGGLNAGGFEGLRPLGRWRSTRSAG